jgi:hypothetical protein
MNGTGEQYCAAEQGSEKATPVHVWRWQKAAL